ncbi:Arginase/agmatinase/formimionoglutamate hydrolase%2C arginase family [uncultured Roseburia sp.]|nr:Arginase/agmatinase/formimionoglutamate hydrolase%2C arginase family [uncultured Roseburia sp.]
MLLKIFWVGYFWKNIKTKKGTTMTTNHLILDFSHVYCDENIPKNTGIHWLDCSEIEECDLYCSRQAEEKIGEKIKPYGIHGIHFLDSGNYHYVTEIMTSQIQKEFQLVVFDHHTDMQKPMIEHMTSCGDWAEKVLETNPWLQQLVLIGPQEKDIEQLYQENDGLMNRKEISEKLLTFSAEEISAGEDKNKISKIKKNLPVYISIDKDILDKQYTETNWSQGNMSLPMLERLLSHFLENGNILGIDICGECQQGIPLPEYLQAEELNEETNQKLFEFLSHYIL